MEYEIFQRHTPTKTKLNIEAFFIYHVSNNDNVSNGNAHSIHDPINNDFVQPRFLIQDSFIR